MLAEIPAATRLRNFLYPWSNWRKGFSPTINTPANPVSPEGAMGMAAACLGDTGQIPFGSCGNESSRSVSTQISWLTNTCAKGHSDSSCTLTECGAATCPGLSPVAPAKVTEASPGFTT